MNIKMDDGISTDGIGIVRFLRGKTFFVTGATGFLAKILIEKILRTVPEVDKIFLLMRAKSNEEAMERLKIEIINKQLFKSLRQTHGNSYESFMLNKLVPVVGNVCESNLGIETELADEIANEVDIIVNSAANTNFRERYDVALDINTRGPCRLMNFAKQCKKLKLFLHISTAYVNGERQGRVLEKPFRMGDNITRERVTSLASTASLPVLDVEAEIKLALDKRETFQSNEVASKMKDLGLERARIYGWQDTYVFTKAMGEMMIDNMRGEIPVVIIRPSIIESTYREPFPGWIEGNRMLDPIILYYGKGLITFFAGDPKGVLDLVPADMVVNATLAAIAKHGGDRKSGINIYQVASSVANPLVTEDMLAYLHEHFISSPFRSLSGESIHISKLLLCSMEDFSSHILADATPQIGQVPVVGKLAKRLDIVNRKVVTKVKYMANIYEPYAFYGGRFDNMNTEQLMEESSEEERRNFGFDVRSIVWKDYICRVHTPGLRRHVMKSRAML